jgi:uncharacterized membrane protein
VFTISLEQGQSIGVMLAVAGAAVVLAVVLYRRAFAMLPPRQRWVLVALRSAAIVLVVVLLFRPVLTYERESRRKPTIVMAVDASQSMSIADDPAGASRFSAASDRLAAWWKRLGGSFDLRLVAFADRARTLREPQQLASLAADGPATSLVRPLVAAAACAKPEDLAAVVLVSDGIHNAAGDPLAIAARLGTTVHTVGVGATLRDDPSYRDVQVTGVECPEHLLLGNRATIKASIEGVGLEGQVIEVTLDDGDEQIGQTELTLDGVEGSQPVEFEFRPTVKGRHNYTVRATPVAGERIEENNRRRAVSLVVEPGIRVLYIEGTLRAEYGAIVDRFLAKDPDLQFCALVQTRPNVFLTRTNIEGLELRSIPADRETLDTFSVFILGDLDSTFLRPEQQRLLVDRVRAGAGLVMLGGYHSLGPGGYAGTAVGEILPAVLGPREIGQLTEPFLPRLTPEGVRHPIFGGIAGFFPSGVSPTPAESGLPPLEGCTRIEAARPDASVLAVCPAVSPAMPVLAVRTVDRGRTAVFTGDTTRRWQQTPRALGRDSPFLRFWGQMVRWLASREESVKAGAGIEASVDKAYYEPDEPVEISAVVRDERGEAAAGANVTGDARLSPTAGQAGSATQGATAGSSSSAAHPRELILSAVQGLVGHYQATFEPTTPGTYEIALGAKVGEVELKAERIAVEVGRPNLEFERLDLNEKLLRQIAERTGGRYEHITTADALIDSLATGEHKRIMVFQRQLYWPPMVWALLVAALTAEWILRRRFQLK